MLSVPGPWMAAEVRRKRRIRTKRTQGKLGQGRGSGPDHIQEAPRI